MNTRLYVTLEVKVSADKESLADTSKCAEAIVAAIFHDKKHSGWLYVQNKEIINVTDEKGRVIL